MHKKTVSIEPIFGNISISIFITQSDCSCAGVGQTEQKKNIAIQETSQIKAYYYSIISDFDFDRDC